MGLPTMPAYIVASEFLRKTKTVFSHFKNKTKLPEQITGFTLRLRYGKEELMKAASRSKSDVRDMNTSGLFPFSVDCGSWYDISKSLIQENRTG